MISWQCRLSLGSDDRLTKRRGYDVRGKAKPLQGRHAPQDFTAKYAGQSYGRHVTSLLVQIDLMGTEDAQVAIGDVRRPVGIRRKAREKV
jgi:hypothetical protein